MALRSALLGLRSRAAPAQLFGGLRAMSSGSSDLPVQVHNEDGKKRVVITKTLPGERWLQLLTSTGCRVEVCTAEKTILSNADIKQLIGDKCDGVIGQLTEGWNADLFEPLKAAGGKAYSNYAVGYNNVDVPSATERGIAVGNTPGVLTETTAELALALTFAAARRVVEGDKFMRAGKYEGWLPQLFVGNLLQRKTVGIIGAGRIGTAYARMMMEGHKCDIVYYDVYPNSRLEEYAKEYCALLESHGEEGLSVTRLDSVDDVLKASDVVSLHCNLDKDTKHLINEGRLSIMKEDAVLVNASRGPVIDETALVAHLKANPNFRCGLDVFEDEPDTKPGLLDCENAVIVPHIASASYWTRAGMATLAAANVASVLQKYPVANKPDVLPWVDGEFDAIPKAAPSIVNAEDLSLEIQS